MHSFVFLHRRRLETLYTGGRGRAVAADDAEPRDGARPAVRAVERMVERRGPDVVVLWPARRALRTRRAA